MKFFGLSITGKTREQQFTRAEVQELAGTTKNCGDGGCALVLVVLRIVLRRVYCIWNMVAVELVAEAIVQKIAASILASHSAAVGPADCAGAANATSVIG